MGMRFLFRDRKFVFLRDGIDVTRFSSHNRKKRKPFKKKTNTSVNYGSYKSDKNTLKILEKLYQRFIQMQIKLRDPKKRGLFFCLGFSHKLSTRNTLFTKLFLPQPTSIFILSRSDKLVTFTLSTCPI